MTEEYLNLSVSHRSTSLTHQKPHARPNFKLAINTFSSDPYLYYLHHSLPLSSPTLARV
jgi:hypothetical protein